MKNILICLTCITICFCPVLAVKGEVISSHDQVIWEIPDHLIESLNGEWDFALAPDTTKWSKIKVPANWETQGITEWQYNQPHEAIGWYRKKFTLHPGWQDKEIFIRLDGVAMGFEL